MTNQQRYSEALAIAKRAALSVAPMILDYFNTDLKIEEKSDFSPVTIADKKAEEGIRAIFARETPEFGIVGEEFGHQLGSGEWEWTVDPIDGTKAFIHRCPLFGTLIGLLHKGKPVVGLMHLPALNWTIAAYTGGPCIWNEQSIHVSSVPSIAESMLCDGSITTMENKGYGVPWRNLRARAKLHRGWGDCYGYALVAMGKAEAMVDPIVSPWDIAPMPVIIEAAGGRFTDLKGNSDVMSSTAIASNGHIHSEILKEYMLFV